MNKENLRSATPKNIFDFIWLILLAIMMTGTCVPSSREAAAYGLFLLAISWLTNEIVGRGIAATGALFFNKKSEDNNHNKEE